MKTKWFVLALTIALLGPARFLRAQVERGTIAGTVKDPSGAVVPGASVTVTNVNTGVEFKTAATDAGQFVAPNLIPGEYSVTVAKPGFKVLVRTGVELHVGERLGLDLMLELGATSQQVEVSARPPLLQRDSSEVKTLISRRNISELPLNGRSVFQLAPLAAGVTNGISQQNANNTSIPDNARAPQGLSINGQAQDANTYVLDGVYNNQINQGLIAILPPLEAVQEFTLVTNNFMPEIGRGGGVMNVTLKSGTNQFHGELFDFLRNSALDARNFFDFSKARRLPNFVQNQFGGTFGGPILKNRLFFFVDTQIFRQRQGQTFVTSVPGQAVRNGNFSGTDFQIFDPATTCGFGSNPPCALDANGRLIETRQPFPNQVIDPSRFSPAAVNVLKFLPLPNDPSGKLLSSGQRLFFSNASRQNDQNNYDIKVDYTLSDRDSVTGHVSRGTSDTILPGAFSAIPQFAPAVGGALGSGGAGFLNGRVSNPSLSVSIGEIHNFGPTTINEFRAAYVRAGSDAVQLGFGHNFADQLGIPNVNVSSNNSGFPSLSIGPLSLIGDSPFFPLIEFENVWQYLDNITFIRGSHTFKAGADFKKPGRNFTQILGFPAGIFSFGGSFTNNPANPVGTGNGIADFLLGIPASGSLIRNSGLAGLRTNEFSAYWQDTWRVTPKLTLNYGLRYDLFTPQTEIFNRMTNFDLGTAKLLLPGQQGSNPNFDNRALIGTDFNNFAPRLGFAYKLDNKTVLRSSYGVFYNASAQVGFQLTQNPPFVGGVINVNDSNPQVINRTLDQGLPTTNPFIPIDQFTGTINAFDPDNRTGYTQQWLFGIQRELAPNLLLEADYVGWKGTHLPDLFNPNQTAPGNGPTLLRQPFGPRVGRLFSFFYQENRANSNYNGLQVTLTKRYSKGLTLLTNWTWSHAVGEPFSDFGLGGHQNSLNLDADRGNLMTDVRHRWVLNWLYELPFDGKSASPLVNGLIGGWQLGGIEVIQGGEPFSVTGGAGRPNRICDGNNPSGGRSINQYFDLSCFTIPAAVPDPRFGGVFVPFGNAGANILRGPHLVNFDFSVFKSFRIGESKRVEFRSEFFNAFNHPKFDLPFSGASGNPGGTITTTGLTGRILSAGPARQIQMVLKFMF